MLALCVVLSLVFSIQAEMESYIVGGSLSEIDQFPHSAFLSISCKKMDLKSGRKRYYCGASIVNQNILLTAGHCVYGCLPGTSIKVYAGNETRTMGQMRSTDSFMHHENFTSKDSAYDIGLIMVMKPFVLNRNIGRVALLRNPPYLETAYVAGWGLEYENVFAPSKQLKSIDQRVWTHNDCVRMFDSMHIGTFCASSRKATDYAAKGDSGSALVVRGYIQIGLVSYKVPELSNNVIIYTDTGYFYDWIIFNIHNLYCYL